MSNAPAAAPDHGTSARPLRSVLYMPASRTSALEKAKTLPADALILDLEDAVAPDAKETARSQAVAAADSGTYRPRHVVIRTNGIDTPWGLADLVAIATSGADAVLVPKVESAAAVLQIDRILRAAGAPDTLRLWVMIETPLGFLDVRAIAGAHPRLACLVVGTSDLANELHALHTRERMPFVTGLQLTVLAARAFGLAVLDGVHLNLDDDAEFEAHCRQGLEFGFDGKTLIHPKQVAIANRVFAPDAGEVEWSRRVIEAHAAAEREGQGVVLLDGRLIENLHVENARRTLARADAITELERADTNGENA